MLALSQQFTVHKFYQLYVQACPPTTHHNIANKLQNLMKNNLITIIIISEIINAF